MREAGEATQREGKEREAHAPAPGLRPRRRSEKRSRPGRPGRVGLRGSRRLPIVELVTGERSLGRGFVPGKRPAPELTAPDQVGLLISVRTLALAWCAVREARRSACREG